MAKKAVRRDTRRRRFTEEFRQQAVQMLLDGCYSAASVAERRELEGQLRRVERERDILKKALAIFGRHE